MPGAYALFCDTPGGWKAVWRAESGPPPGGLGRRWLE